MKSGLFGIVVVGLMLLLVVPVDAVVVVDEFDDVLHYSVENNFPVIETELRPHIDIVRMESVVENDTLRLEIELADDVWYTNESMYYIGFTGLDVGYSYTFQWFNGSFDNSSDYLAHTVVGNSITCFFRWNTSFNESNFELICISLDTVGYDETWFDYAPDYNVPYLFYVFKPGFLRYPYCGRGFSYIGRNVHVSKSVNISITVEYQSLFNTSVGGSISDFCVTPQKFFGGHIRVLLVPLVARFNVTMQVRNFSQSWVGVKIGSWVFVNDVFYGFEQQPLFVKYFAEYGISRFFEIKKSLLDVAAIFSL